MKRRLHLCAVCLLAIAALICLTCSCSRSVSDLPGNRLEGTVHTAAGTAADQGDVSPTEFTDYCRIISLNRLFGDFLHDDLALIEEACVVLLDKAVEHDGIMIIEQKTVNDFIFSLYGVKVDPTACHYDFISAPAGYYPILPRGYAEISHRITDVSVFANGDIRVQSDMTVAYTDDDRMTMPATTVLRPDNGRFGYIVISAYIDEDLLDQSQQI